MALLKFHQKSVSFQRFITILWNGDWSLGRRHHFPPAMILRYCSALWAALALAASVLEAQPWQTVIGWVDSSTRHWHRPLRLRSSETRRKQNYFPSNTYNTVSTYYCPQTHLDPGNWHQNAAPKTGRSAKSKSWSQWECPEGECEAGGSSLQQSSAGSPKCSWSFYFYRFRPCSPCAVWAAVEKTGKGTRYIQLKSKLRIMRGASFFTMLCSAGSYWTSTWVKIRYWICFSPCWKYLLPGQHRCWSSGPQGHRVYAITF